MSKIETIKDLGESLLQLQTQMKRVLRESGYDQYEELNISTDIHDPNEQFLKDEYRGTLGRIQSIVDTLEYLNTPIRAEGNLYRNENGRFEFNDIYELTSGNSVEFLHYDRFDECEKWIAARIEHSGDYYLYGYKDIPLEGLRVRIRR